MRVRVFCVCYKTCLPPQRSKGPACPSWLILTEAVGCGGHFCPALLTPLHRPRWRGFLLQGERLAVSRKAAPLPHQVEWALEAGADPPARVIGRVGPVTCPGFPASPAKQSRSSDPIPQCGEPPRKEHPSGWRQGPDRPVLFPPPRVWTLSSWGPFFSQCSACVLSNKAWCRRTLACAVCLFPSPPGP